MKAVILVGGEGTRMRPLSLATPKQLLPVAGRPLLEHVLANLVRGGVTEAVIATGHMAEAFEALPDCGIRVSVMREDKPLGSAGPVRAALDWLGGETVLVCNGDILTDIDVAAMIAFHSAQKALTTIAVTRVEDPTMYGLVPLDQSGRVTAFIEKPSADQIVTDLINAGLWICEPQVIDRIDHDRFSMFERDIFPAQLAAGERVYGYRSNGYWLGVDNAGKYLDAVHDVLEGLVGMLPPGTLTPSGAWVGEGVRIDPPARLRGPAYLGDGCRIEASAVVHARTSIGQRCRIGPGARVEESVLHDDVVVDADAVVERSVLGSGVHVGARTRVVDAVLGAGVIVGADNELRSGVRLWPGVTLGDGVIRF